MNPPSVPDEPLKNIELESTILGMRMALTPEEETEAREKFLQTLATSTLVVPTVNPVKTNPDGSIAENSDITFIVVESKDAISGIPAFTSLGLMRATLPNAQNGVFMSGSQLAGIVIRSPHKLFVDGPDMHAEVEKDELVSLAQAAQQVMEVQQAAVNHNETLEKALAAFAADDNDETREGVKAAFLGGFCRVPVARDQAEGEKCLVLRTPDPQDSTKQQNVPLITEDGALVCFTSEPEMRKWRDLDRHAFALPGPMICEMVAGSGVGKLRINPADPDSRLVQIEPPNRFTIL